jgi:hypothetical protein
MSDQTANSRNGVPIRLPERRWQHIIDEHGELAELRDEVLLAISNADRVLAGSAGERLAIREIEPSKVIVVVYRETESDDGFVITAFLTRRLRSLERREQLWPPRT